MDDRLCYTLASINTYCNAYFYNVKLEVVNDN